MINISTLTVLAFDYNEFYLHFLALIVVLKFNLKIKVW